jgi:UDP-N-acetylmuramyl pentapeptide phosphotransferase/UDP-N-acetylglucosamine-1-phosphate transferase
MDELARWALALAVGFLGVRFLRVTTRALFASPSLQRENHRGATVPTAGGLLLVLAVLLVEAARAVVGAVGVGDDPGLDVARNLVLFGVLGYGLLGLVDDLLAEGTARGFRGHLREATRGRLTTGFLKLAGGAAVAVVMVASPGFASGRRLLVDAVLIALCANLANLLDRAPGRTLKVALAAYVPLALALGGSAVGIALAPVLGAALGLAPDDLRERLMLGDTGANVVGAILGLGVVLGLGSTSRVSVLAVVAVLNVAAEVVSFSRVIDATPPLRALDRWGRPRPGQAGQAARA